MSGGNKDTKQRVQEAVQIRSQLERIGALMDERTDAVVKKHLNLYVRESLAGEFSVRIGTARACVRLCPKQGGQSGITLEA